MTREEERDLRAKIQEQRREYAAAVEGLRVPTNEEGDALIISIASGEPPPKNEPRYLSVHRKFMTADMEEIRKLGGIVQIPSVSPL